ncbi:MAG: hypothetical protein R3E61_04560 [Pseudomonadales bacterium]
MTTTGGCTNVGNDVTITSSSVPCVVHSTRQPAPTTMPHRSDRHQHHRQRSQTITVTTPAPATADFGDTFTVAATSAQVMR